MQERDANLWAHFAAAYSGRADATVLETEDGLSPTFADIDRQSAAIANHLASLGVTAGDRVSVKVEKSPENLSLYLACLRAGYAYHPLNPAYKHAELEYFIGNAEPTVVVCDPADEAGLGDLVAAAGARRLLTLDRSGGGSLLEGSAAESAEFETVHREPGDLAALLYSSGTTGVPKGIMLTHENLRANAEALVGAWGFTADDRLLHALPIFHVHGLFVAIGCALLAGARMRWLGAFDARNVVERLPGCTVMMGVPTYYTRLLSDASFTAECCASMRLFVSGSAPLLEETFHAFERQSGHRILERYGMTETNMNTSNPLDGPRKPGTVGPPLPGVEVRVVGEDGGQRPTNETGNLEVRGPNVFAGYWRMPDKTAEDFADDGFFRTGDLASIDDDGYVSIVGRAKDLVITGGLNVYPKEVEAFIDRLPGVRESAVVGIPHADFGEAVVAVVVPEAPDAIEASAIIEACRAELANFKVPKRVLFVDALPRNTMAKVQKNELRDTYGDIFD